jgi:hypothetical protein
MYRKPYDWQLMHVTFEYTGVNTNPADRFKHPLKQRRTLPRADASPAPYAARRKGDRGLVDLLIRLRE